MRFVITFLFFLVPLLTHAQNTSTRAIPTCPQQIGYEEGKYWVSAASAALRETGATDGKLISWLVIGTELEVTCQEEGWVHVLIPINNSTVKGLIRADLLQKAMPQLATLLTLTAKTPDPAKKRQLAERTLELYPLEIAAYRLLIEAHDALGDKTASDKAKGILESILHPKVERKPGEPQIIFAYADEFITPIAILEQGRLRGYPKVMVSAEKKLLQSIQKRFYVLGRAYNVYAGGGKVGMVQVTRSNFNKCLGFVPTNVKLINTQTPFGGGIASNFELGEQAPVPDRKVSAAEEKRLLDFALAELRRHKVRKADIKTIMAPLPFELDGNGNTTVSRQLIAIPQKNSPYPNLFAILNTVIFRSLPSTDMVQYRLNLVAEADQNGQYSVTYRSYETSTSEASFSNLRYVTHMDLTQSGTEALIFNVAAWESWWHEILIKENGQWKALRLGEDGCV